MILRWNEDATELDFILACLTHRLYAERPLPQRPLCLDWFKTYDLLVTHRLAGLFFILGREHADLWPRDFQDRLRDWRYVALLRGDHCALEIKETLDALRRMGLPVIVLKGWAAIPTLYGGDHGQRTYLDIDLFVHPTDAARVDRLLRDQGHSPVVAEPWPRHSLRYGYTQSYERIPVAGRLGQRFSIGLHLGLLGVAYCDRRVSASNLFARARPLQVAGVEVSRLAADDELVYQCGHLGLHHSYDDTLLNYYELAAGIRQAGEQFDWGQVRARAVAWRLAIPVQRVLARLDALWPGVVPAPALADIVALRPTFTERIVHDLTAKRQDNHSLRAFLDWLYMPGLSRRWGFFWETAFPSPAYLQQRYGSAPAGLWPLLYFRRATAALAHLAPGDRDHLRSR